MCRKNDNDIVKMENNVSHHSLLQVVFPEIKLDINLYTRVLQGVRGEKPSLTCSFKNVFSDVPAPWLKLGVERFSENNHQISVNN